MTKLSINFGMSLDKSKCQSKVTVLVHDGEISRMDAHSKHCAL
jgi:hypothetical protein